MSKYTKESVETATKVASVNGNYLCGEFDESGDYCWEVGFGDYTCISKEDIEVLYAALNSLDEGT